MNNGSTMRRGRRSERGEGYGKLVAYLMVLAIAGYLAIKNVPTYLQVQNLKHELAEKARGAGTMNVPVERVRKEVDLIVRDYDVPAEHVKVTKDGKTLRIRLSTTKKLDLLVTDYEWKIQEESTGAAL